MDKTYEHTKTNPTENSMRQTYYDTIEFMNDFADYIDYYNDDNFNIPTSRQIMIQKIKEQFEGETYTKEKSHSKDHIGSDIEALDHILQNKKGKNSNFQDDTDLWITFIDDMIALSTDKNLKDEATKIDDFMKCKQNTFTTSITISRKNNKIRNTFFKTNSFIHHCETKDITYVFAKRYNASANIKDELILYTAYPGIRNPGIRNPGIRNPSIRNPGENTETTVLKDDCLDWVKQSNTYKNANNITKLKLRLQATPDIIYKNNKKYDEEIENSIKIRSETYGGNKNEAFTISIPEKKNGEMTGYMLQAYIIQSKIYISKLAQKDWFELYSTGCELKYKLPKDKNGKFMNKANRFDQNIREEFFRLDNKGQVIKTFEINDSNNHNHNNSKYNGRYEKSICIDGRSNADSINNIKALNILKQESKTLYDMLEYVMDEGCEMKIFQKNPFKIKQRDASDIVINNQRQDNIQDNIQNGIL